MSESEVEARLFFIMIIDRLNILNDSKVKCIKKKSKLYEVF